MIHFGDDHASIVAGANCPLIKRSGNALLMGFSDIFLCLWIEIQGNCYGNSFMEKVLLSSRGSFSRKNGLIVLLSVFFGSSCNFEPSGSPSDFANRNLDAIESQANAVLGQDDPDNQLTDPEDAPPGAAPGEADAEPIVAVKLYADGGSCMECHNGSKLTDYAGDGIENPHPFGGVDSLTCQTCHGGNPEQSDKKLAHVPPPPEIGNKKKQEEDPQAQFNRLTLTGIDKFDNYKYKDVEYSSLDYLQFINPGDMRVVEDGRGCGQVGCHVGHTDWFSKAPIKTQTGMFSAPFFQAGIPNAVADQVNLWESTAADISFRPVFDQDWTFGTSRIGTVQQLKELDTSKMLFDNKKGIVDNEDYFVENLENSIDANNSVIPDSPLHDLLASQVDVTCGDCHAGSAGANNRFADFRSSGCTTCHMQYSLDGRSFSSDKNIKKNEPKDPDAIAAGERPHPYKHRINSVHSQKPNGVTVQGITDMACAGCHQGSNRTVMQYMGIRLDQNQDLVNGFQYPAAPKDFENTEKDKRLFDPKVKNLTFNGRNANQYILEEDYDGDKRDDTPADIHYEAGMGCIDCHTGRELHGGANGDPTSGDIVSRRHQNLSVGCKTCHGGGESYASTVDCTSTDGVQGQCVVDKLGNSLNHVTVNAQGEYWLKSKVTGAMHYVKQTKDVISNNNKTHPVSGEPIFSAKASFAMGRSDGNAATGIGPVQAGDQGVPSNFSHMDDMECATCHSAWQNNCVGCHLGMEYDANPDNFNFSNITGERIAVREQAADFVYQHPGLFQLGVSPDNKISTIQSMANFFRFQDLKGDVSKVFTFTDRNGRGADVEDSALSHYPLAAHTIRGKPTSSQEGTRGCPACHLTQEGLQEFGSEYKNLMDAMDTGDYTKINFNLMKKHIGENTGNQLNSPFFVHMAAGLGTGLFLFDENGCPVNPLDQNPNRHYCPDGAPAANFNAQSVNETVRYNLDRFVDKTGKSTSSNIHPMHDGKPSPLRDGAQNPNMSGPLGATIIRRLTDPDTGIVLDSFLDADGKLNCPNENTVLAPGLNCNEQSK